MNVLLAVVLLIILFFIIRFMYFCHKDFFISYYMLEDKNLGPLRNIDRYYLLNKRQRDHVNLKDKNYLPDVSEIMFKNSTRNEDVKDIYDFTKVNCHSANSYGFW